MLFEKVEKIGDVELAGPVIVGVMRRLSVHDAHESGADIIELRLDLLEEEDKSTAKVKEFITELKQPVIVTNRRKEEGGSFAGTEAQRIELLNDILETGSVNAVDIEFYSPEASKSVIVEKAKSLHIPIIFSFHDFYGMPSRSDILNIIAGMYEEGGSIAKIAVTPKRLSDALLLLNMTHELATEGKRMVTIGMGAIGRHLRVIAPLYGSVLTYGFIEGEGVAPGQFSVKALRRMLNELMLKKSVS
ncbi:3-dehydroquinate dehydratase-1 [Methanophagales archaeon]|nr:3-dehydroquinate dehydratase-1 [Methanophagales archaeon]